MKKRTYYLFVPKSNSFSSIYAKTLKIAREERLKYGECPNGTPENKAYWKKQMEGGKIVKVTEITEEIE